MSALLPTRLRTAANGMKGIHAAVVREAADEIERLSVIENAARALGNSINGGFVRCEHCGDQESTTDLDFADALFAALGIEPKPY